LAADKHLKDQNIGRAAARLRDALRRTPDDQRLQMAYLRVIIQQKGPAAGLKLLESALAAPRRGWKDSAQLRMVRSQLFTQLKPPDVKAKLAELEIGVSDYRESEQFRLWQALGSAYYSLAPRDLDSAGRCWENAASLRPTDLRVAEILFDLSRDRGDELGQMVVMNQMKDAFGPQSAEWKLFRAKQLVASYRQDPADRSDLVEAAQIAEDVSKVRPDWDLGALLSAEIHDLQGHGERAIASYQQGLKLGQPRPPAVRRLVELLMADARYAEARLALEKLDPLPTTMLRYKVLLEAMGGNQQQALDALSDAIDVDSVNPDDFLWKGRVLNHLKQPDKATRSFVRAVQLAPGLPQAWLTLVQHLVRNGRPRDAENFARQAENHLSADRAPLVLAQAYALLGNHALAEQYYQTALAATPENLGLRRTVAAYYLGTGQGSKAERHLRGLLQLTDSNNPSRSAHAVWARRMLAQVLAKDGSYLRFRTGLALLAANRVAGELSELDQRIKAELLGARVEPRFREEAVHILERLQGGARPLSLSLGMLLARLYDQSNRWSKARDLMIDIVSENPKNADVLAQLSEMLLNRKEIDMANRWIVKLAQIEPTSYRTLRLRARNLVQLAENREARQLIDSWLPKPLKSGDANRVLQAAGLLEELKFRRAAEDKFTTFDKLASGKSLALAGFLARNGRIDEAFQLAADRVNDENVQGVARVAMFAIARQPLKVTDAHFQRAQKWFDRALAKSPGDLDLKLNWSSALEVLGKGDQAERILTDALKANLTPQQRGTVVNNLAYLRAVRGATDDDTLRLVDTAAKLIGPHPSVLDSRAMVHLAQGQCSRAIDQLEKATSFGVDSGLYYFHLALAHQCASDRSSARRAIEEADEKGFSRQQLGVSEQQRYQQLENWLAL
jgi:tetratricopeptide (TPR) repeat protein